MKKRDLRSRSNETNQVVNGKQKSHEMELLNPKSDYVTKIGEKDIR